MATEPEITVEAERFVREHGFGGPASIQRRFGIGYFKATRLLELLVERGVLEPINRSGQYPLRKEQPHG